MYTTRILGIETSCDDTSLCIIEGPSGVHHSRPNVLSLMSFSSEKLLYEYGGVVPELAARNHMAKLPLLLRKIFHETKLDLKDIDQIAVTTYPGLLGPLLTGLSAAKTLAMTANLPIQPVNHLYAHLEAIHLTEDITYPYIGLLVSGGHSLYLLVEGVEDFRILGSTIDDAAGEAFDKGGKLLGIGYPAGRLIDELAASGNKKRYSFPIGLKDSKDSRLSFSGVKTSLRQFLIKNPDFPLPTKKDILDKKEFHQDFHDLCASYQEAIVSALSLKLKFALKQKLPIVVGGGVACNSSLRERLTKEFDQVSFVAPKYCTDNGAMIANYALRNYDKAINYPACLNLDARSKFISKKDYL